MKINIKYIYLLDKENMMSRSVRWNYRSYTDYMICLKNKNIVFMHRYNNLYSYKYYTMSLSENVNYDLWKKMT